MTKSLGYAGMLCAALTLTGCIESETVITVGPDGSGTVEEVFMITDQAREHIAVMMRSLSSGLGGSPDDSGAAGDLALIDRERLRENAGRMGEGVRFVSAKPVRRRQARGFRAVYAFDDITMLKVNQNPADHMPAHGGAEVDGVAPEYLTFAFTAGPEATLVIRQNRHVAANARPGHSDVAHVDPEDLEAAIAQAREMFDGMRIAVNVVVTGTVIETNASHRKKNVITLLDMDFDAIAADRRTLRRFSAARPQSIAEARALVHDAPGITVETSDAVTVSFR